MDNTISTTGKRPTLAERIARNGVLNAHDAAMVTLHLVKEIGKLHAAGKVHRRISAHNVCVDDSLSPVLDPVESSVEIGTTHADSLPYPQQLLDVSPLSLPADMEAARQALTAAGVLLDPRQVDFYQLAAILCFMVSGRGISDYLRSCRVKAAVPATIRPIVDRALSLDASNRFDTVDAFMSQLQAVASSKSPTQTNETPHSPAPLPASQAKDSALHAVNGGLPFKTLKHYEIVECIGHGGMGDVYKAYERALDRFVAIKVLPPELARQQDLVKRFHAEAAAIAKLDHPNIVQVYYSGQDRGYHFFAMQYVEGESLAHLLARRGRLRVSEAQSIVRQCLLGLNAAHKKGLVHRDIKPGNVLLDRHGRRALIADFGVVKSLQSGTHATTTGTVLGTADYIAPEQACGAAVDFRVDLYAMGILMYQMFSGRLPFEADSATSMMFQHAYEPPPPLSQVAPEVPEKLAAVVMKLLEKRPEDRYQSTDEVLFALGEVLAADPPTDVASFAAAEALELDWLPETPDVFAESTASNKLRRLWFAVADFFGAQARQVLPQLQTTTQQVDGVIDDCQRQRAKLAELTAQAAAVAEQLQTQAQAARAAARAAAEHAEAARTAAVGDQALQDKQQSELQAARLAQQAAEQAGLAEDLNLRLAKADARLVQLRARRDALRARMDAAEVRLRNQGAGLDSRFAKRRIAALSILLLGASAIVFAVSRAMHQSPAPKPTPPYAAYIISFRTVPASKASTSKQLLDAFNEDCPLGVRTHHFRTQIANDTLTGLICVDDKTGADAVVDTLRENSDLELLGVVAATREEFDRHCLLGQPSLRPEAPSADSPVVYLDGLGSETIIVRDPRSTPNFVRAILGEPTRTDYDGAMLRYTNRGFDLFFSGDGPLSEVHLNKGFKGRLNTGISLDSEQQEVFAAYGSPIKTLTAASLSGKNNDRILYRKDDQSRIFYRSHGLIFWFKGQSITQIVPTRGTIKSPPQE